MASSSEVSETPYWIHFFTDAGIPAGEAANHAVTFTDHRIHKDMLMDLSKEYLNDMDITKMGDVIAILKHAKVVHTKNARDRALETASKCSPTTRTASPVPHRSTAASRMVEHYIGSDSSASPLNKPPSPKLSAALSARLGNTGPGKSSVFERLGSESPSNGSKVTVTEVGNIIVKSSQQPSVFNRLGDKNALKRPATSTSDVTSSEPALEYEGILKSVSMKKQKMSKLTITKKVAVDKKTETMAVDDSVSTEGILSRHARCEQLSLKDRLGKKLEAGMVSSTTDNNTTVSMNKLNVTKKSLKARLGPKIAESSSNTSIRMSRKTNTKKGVFGRLGEKVPK